MASYSFKKEDLDKPKDDTGIKFPLKGIRYEERMKEIMRKNDKEKSGKIYQDWEISTKPKGHTEWAELPDSDNESKGINHGERRGEKGGRFNQRTSKNGNSYRQYF